jgi:hypothetical protein
MSRKLIVLCLSTAVACFSLAPSARAQVFLEGGEFSAAGTTTPFTTAFDNDLEFLTPFEDSGFGNFAAEPVGWFGNYNRLYWNVSPPEDSQKADGDFGWGNRFDFGFMTPDRSGWLVDIVGMSGPNLPTNSSEMSGFEVDRMWQMPLENGTMLMPNFAVRYMNIIDRTLPMNHPRFGTVGSAGNNSPTKNNIIGGQVGLGWQMRRGAWVVDTNAKMFVAENFQVFTTQVFNPNDPANFASGPGTSRREFVPCGELNLNIAYSLTRDIAMNLGWDMIYMGSGIARQGQVEANDESMMYNGLGFGITFNR